MARDEKRRQQSLQRKAAKQKRSQQARILPPRPSSQSLLRSAGEWPVHECLIARKWNEEGALVQVLVARRSATDEIAAGVFVVDLGCLGVKNAFARVMRSPIEYENLRRRMMESQPMMRADLDLAAKIIRESIAYAGRFGFQPHPDYREASILLTGADPDACTIRIPLGKDGKPFFVAGPYDNVPKVMARLTQAVGPGDFQYLVPLGPPPTW